MKLISRLVLTAAMAALLPAAQALAADYDPPIIMEDAVVDYAPEVPVEVGNGWYLRGDIGYAFSQSLDGPFTFRAWDSVASTYTTHNYATNELTNPFSFGGGFGYAFTDYLRADVTIDVFKTRFSGTTSTATPCFDAVLAPILVGTGCRTEDEANALGVSMLANAYVDLGTYAGFTPYVGAGVGATYVKWNDVTRQNYCVGGLCPTGFNIETTHPGVESLRFTWAAMAGLSYDVSNTMKIDLGYRYRRIAGGDMYGFSNPDSDNGATGVQAQDSGQTQHEVRVGVRYELW